MELDLKHECVKKVKELHARLMRVPMRHEVEREIRPGVNIDILFGCYDFLLAAAGMIEEDERPAIVPRKPKIGIIDIECAPMEVFVWQLKTEYVPIEMIIKDWSLISFAAKFHDEDEVHYYDVSQQEDRRDDRVVAKYAWNFLNQCDIVIGQNSKRFDIPKLNGKFQEYGYGPTKPFKQKDTYQIKKQLGLSSNKLAFSTEKLNKKYKKLDHKEFPGSSLFIECLRGNKNAFVVNRNYNIHDVLATEELYFGSLINWDKDAVNFGVYMNEMFVCKRCGSDELEETWIDYTMAGAYQGFTCKACGSFSKGKKNLLKKSVRQGLLK
jgi:hypothetical protein